MSDLSLSNFITISVSSAPAGIGSYNTSNLALFSGETPGSDFGTDGFKIYKTASDVVTDFGTNSATAAMAISIFSQKPNILAGQGYLVVVLLQASEPLDAAITRTKDLVQYFGIITDSIMSQADMLAAAAVVQTLNKVLFVVSKTATDVNSGGMLDLIRTGSLDQTRGLLYIGSGSTPDALGFLAAYAGRALSTDFSGSNTTQTMHLKDLKGVQPDAGMTQTILQKCLTAGVDAYASFQGVPKVFTSGANGFFDRVYNRLWFAGALEVAGFNALAESSSKLPQTEQGVSILKAAYRTVCEQAVQNQYSAPGEWTGTDTFGNQKDFVRNIEERGYYIYSQPVSAQLAADRADRKAPLIQIALKEAGAVHSSSVIININA
jgi:hypothetical protein